MQPFIAMSAADRSRFCQEAEGRIGLSPASIEKDFWVCWILRQLFTLPEWGGHLTFKGGTALSKGWKLIERFSEDIDIVDRSHNAALWREVRETLDYPVFSAAPDAVGITSTGADGPNRLPDVLAAYRRFEAWVAAGAKPDSQPAFEH